MTKQEKLLTALQNMQAATRDCTDLEICYLGYAMIQAASVLHGIPVEHLLLNCAANVNVVRTDDGLEVQIPGDDDDDE